MLTNASGDLLHAGVDALVNTVNTVGVMGKGIALQFRRAYPEMFTAYAKACKAGEVQLGHMHVWETGALGGPRFIINFPTKAHWRNPSQLADIRSGLDDLINVIREHHIASIAVPPLGCGNGGLDWSEVEPLIRDAFQAVPEVDARVYAPAAAPRADQIVNATPRPTMTVGRAALVSLIDRYTGVALGATPIEVQKLMYFLQTLGEPLRLNYVKHLYGPYAGNLRQVLDRVEKHFLVGYGDGSARVLDAEPIRAIPDAVVEATAVLEREPATTARVEQVLDLIDGFESMYGMELLASVHWVMASDAAAAEDWQRTVSLVHEWSPRKRRMFTDDHIRTAWTAIHHHDSALFACQ
ncbi:macro domain-containing protein [Gordonia sp. CPCC 206044]|uniref:type II toxin-antitoxin system antitoxin DNA ADP-ribosyl glycohydrolase DarG n=1 Tax=Gordonia sp. CPCC 206044 TaxID=3140793 RepID=UPI003AF39725